MLLDQNGGGMAVDDLRTLIESRIPEHRNSLETSHINLENVAAYCEGNYVNTSEVGRSSSFEETKQFALQSLASVAYQINTLARDLLDMLDIQTDKISTLTNQVDNVNMVVNIHKEKLARREIGVLTTNKSIPKQPKIITPAVQEPIPRYKRTQVDFSVLDGVGHGVRNDPPPQQRSELISRAASSISAGNPHYGQVQYVQYERTANINNTTLSRSSLRSGHLSMALSEHHYRIPQISKVVPLLDHQRFSSVMQNQHHLDYGSDNVSILNTNTECGNSQHGSSEYGGDANINRYTSSRGHAHPSGDFVDGRSESPGFPLPPPQISSHYGYAMAVNTQDLPPPAIQMLNSMHEDDPLPPPPSQTNFFDTQADWVPKQYIEKAIALYDYDADKPDELSLRENCVVYVLRKNEDGWYEGVLDGVTGLFPGNYVQPA